MQLKSKLNGKQSNVQEDINCDHLESPLTNLLQNTNGQAVLACVLAIALINLFIQLVIYYFHPSLIWQDFGYLHRQGKNVTFAIAFWFLLHIILYSLVYPVGSRLYNRPWIVGLTGCVTIPLTIIPTLYCILHFDLQYLLTFSLAVENLRLIMKSISFLTEQVTLDDPEKATLGKFTYFLFAPTLIYRHKYLRNKGPVNWKKVFEQFGILILYCYFGLIELTRRGLDAFNGPFTPYQLISLYIECVLVGTLLYFGLAFGFLHCYMNAFAEMTKFADRRFYSDWWNARSGNQFWRNWNLLVHVWFVRYIYGSWVKLGGGKYTASFVVFFVSGVLHEYATGLALRVWYPVYWFAMVLFGFLRLSRSLEKVEGIWPLIVGFISLIFPISLMVFTYGLEYGASRECPLRADEVSFVRFIPRFVHCTRIIY